jgi:uncharacterized membrane protein
MNGANDGALAMSVRWTLSIGILVAATLLVVGLSAVLLQGPPDFLAPPGRVTVSSLPSHLASGSGPSILLLGTLVLVLTPIARVLVSFAHFTHNRDRSFVAITAFVLAVLAVSVAIGLSP